MLLRECCQLRLNEHETCCIFDCLLARIGRQLLTPNQGFDRVDCTFVKPSSGKDFSGIGGVSRLLIFAPSQIAGLTLRV